MVFGKKKNVIGLDIGTSSIKVVELDETNRGYRLVNCATSPIPPEAIVDGSLIDQSSCYHRGRTRRVDPVGG